MKKEIKFSGVGLMSGKPVNVAVKPSRQLGIWFRRVDLPGQPMIPAKWNYFLNTGITNTTLSLDGATVQTIEHFMAALFVCGIDSAVIEIDNPEFPIMDGAVAEFIKMLKPLTAAGVQGMQKIVVKKEIIATRQEIIKTMPLLKRLALWLHGLKTGRKEDGFVKLSPDSRGLVLDIVLDYPDKAIGRQRTEFIFNDTAASRENFIKNIARARTFGRLWEWKYLKKRGMGLGANEKNVLVLMDEKKDWENLQDYTDDKKLLARLLKNKGDSTLTKLYWSDEFARHKLIDAVGDLYTSGGMIVGKFESYKGSHALNNLALRKLFADPSNYEIRVGAYIIRPVRRRRINYRR